MSDQLNAGATSETTQTLKRYTPFSHTFILTRRILKGDYDGQMILGGLVGLKLPDICLTGEENSEKTSPRKFVPTGDRTWGRCVTGAHAIACSTAVDEGKNYTSKYGNYKT